MAKSPSSDRLDRINKMMEHRAELIASGGRPSGSTVMDKLNAADDLINRASSVAGSESRDAHRVQKVLDMASHSVKGAKSMLGGSDSYGSIHSTVPTYAPRHHDSELERYGEDSKPPGTFSESLKMGAGLGLGVLAVVAGVGLVARSLS